MTGWTWTHVAAEVTLPQVRCLSNYWKRQPPMVILASRLCRSLGIEVGAAPKVVAKTPEDALHEAMSFGMPVNQGKPDDPDLAFLDD